MDPKEFFIWAAKILALGSAIGAALVEVLSSAEDKHERITRLLLSSITYSLLVSLF